MRSFMALMMVFLVVSCTDQGPQVVKVGISQWVSNQEFERNISAFQEQLTRAGYVEGDTIEYLVANPEGSKDKQRDIIKKFVNEEVDLIYSLTTPGTLIAKELAPDTPIVFSVVTYPVEAEVIDSLESSGNNLVGTRNYMPVERQLDTFLNIVGDIKNVGFVHRENEPNSLIQLKSMRSYAKTKGIKIVPIDPGSVEQLSQRLDQVKSNIDALYSACDTLVQGGGEEIVVDFAKQHNLPDFTCNRSGVRKGSLVGNIADFSEIGGMSGKKAATILKGDKKPSELMTESPSNNFIVLNISSAKRLNISLSPEKIKQASEVIR